MTTNINRHPRLFALDALRMFAIVILIGRNNIVRIDPEISSPIALDNFRAAKIRLPDLAKTTFGRYEQDIQPFFQNQTDPRERHYCKK